jgi:hypothetical protein
LNVTIMAFAALVIRKTFLELEEDSEKVHCRSRAMTDSMMPSACFWQLDEQRSTCGSEVSTAEPSSMSWADCESPRSCASGGSFCLGEETRTTLILQGLPKSCSRDRLLQLLDVRGMKCEVDFAYVPVDLLSMETCGFAFVNFASVSSAQRALAELQGVQMESSTLEACWSEKDQGLELLVERHRNSPLMHPSMPAELRPLLLQEGVPVPFPAPTKKIKLQSLMLQLRRRQRASA